MPRCDAAELDDVAKAQYVRLIDVFALGPAMFYAAWKLPRDVAWLRAFFVVAGAGTVYYNARNYLAIEQRLARTPRLRRRAWWRLP